MSAKDTGRTRIVAVACLERILLDEPDPPLNLQGMRSTAVRQRLKELRRAIMIELRTTSSGN